MTCKRKNYYFTQDHEDAIVAYCDTEDSKLRNDLYKEFIGPVFNEMVDKIVFTYKFNTLPNSEALRDDCKNWLITILNKYDPNKGSKAFTYFSVVTKNWFIAQVKKTSKKARKEILLEDFYIDKRSGDEKTDPSLIEQNTIIEDSIKLEFFLNLKKEIDSWHTLPLKPNEKKTVQAIQVLFDDAEKIEIFNKKAIYLYIREITGLNTKQVVSSLNRIRKRYREFKKGWDEI
jgi:hypothetical protein|tara:strand:+ start:60 stop:752 length:693 start_codon:yes stop_codon:yes gene_type:complete